MTAFGKLVMFLVIGIVISILIHVRCQCEEMNIVPKYFVYNTNMFIMS